MRDTHLARSRILIARTDRFPRRAFLYIHFCFGKGVEEVVASELFVNDAQVFSIGRARRTPSTRKIKPAMVCSIIAVISSFVRFLSIVVSKTSAIDFTCSLVIVVMFSYFLYSSCKRLSPTVFDLSDSSKSATKIEVISSDLTASRTFSPRSVSLFVNASNNCFISLPGSNGIIRSVI
jgi:hypothetical protein